MAQTNPKLRHFYDLLSETIIANLDEIITFFSTNFSCLDFLWEDYFAEKKYYLQSVVIKLHGTKTLFYLFPSYKFINPALGEVGQTM